MRLILALAALALPLASSAAHGPATKAAATPVRSGALPIGGAGCRRPDVHPADSINRGRFNRLGELPPGQLMLTVVREIDGCPEPVIVGQGYGFNSPPHDARPTQPRARRW
jgi:hypothetical protein